MSFIDIDNIIMNYRDGESEQLALNNISFSVSKGEFLCIIGSSGCGKTTLLRIMAGFLRPTNGRVLYNGKELLKPRMEYAFIFQNQEQLFPWKTALQNVLYPLKLKKVDKGIQMRLAEEYFNKVNLNFNDDSSKYPHQLSAGMKQRVTLARALAMNPSLLFMDEPFSSVDKYIRDNLHKVLLQLWKEFNLTIIFITHDIDEAIRLSSRIIILGKGHHGIVGDFKNNVVGERYPTDNGYSELWNTLYNGIGNG